MDSLKVKAYGKINIGLDVMAKREDGYHEVRMVMQTVRIHDNIKVDKASSGDISITTNLGFIPTDKKNLVYKAAKLLMDEFAINCGVSIDLQKHIPVSAGMGGGSSDAAAILYAMNKLFKLGLSKKELMERGALIGADVPFCLMKGTALAEGIGENVTRIAPMPECCILIAKPGFSVSTKHVYEKLRLNEIQSHPDIDGIIDAIEEEDIYEMSSLMGNVLESVTVKEHPVIEDIKMAMIDNGALNSIMSGSGPSVFGIFDEPEEAEFAMNAIREMKLAKQIFLTEPHNVE
ncbi:4-(cytidine 5'-diphospho)-2-C-methyl-D-erythritol kinase [Parasporobacterium paucivorans]|uniref:4-diphosphocytidyl-2-C-methyl-D-erythritol kinase n=1 Tax=Parasporobacterium paucivorans DSM 15970 TaxID=1122934 RepID=A0A1M6BEK7_9FIRM|nr:4-(cytidine 5'-diphospho)-2-C-methyl-D-erythritol kinase [Parasporobacterium paucivorans]SHI47107.1 4-diphosphocytidyl-2-C-methyl-D-erythritol kinase [Parasporobacterium paucivorans DSM 15970]